jgi:uncharacterized membrane protein YhaH (DUF805 family)
MEWYLMVWKKFGKFDGRSRRKEYWMFVLFNTLICLSLFLPCLALRMRGIGLIFFTLYVIYLLIALIPSIACAVRRLHDTGKSGWWLLIGLIPLISLLLIVFLAIDSEPDSNEYGPNPKFSQQPA